MLSSCIDPLSGSTSCSKMACQTCLGTNRSLSSTKTKEASKGTVSCCCSSNSSRIVALVVWPSSFAPNSAVAKECDRCTDSLPYLWEIASIMSNAGVVVGDDTCSVNDNHTGRRGIQSETVDRKMSGRPSFTYVASVCVVVALTPKFENGCADKLTSYWTVLVDFAMGRTCQKSNR